jgi:hypothetical protein
MGGVQKGELWNPAGAFGRWVVLIGLVCGSRI